MVGQRPPWRAKSVGLALGALASLLALAGCTAPIGADRATVRQLHRHFSSSAIDGRLSDASRFVLHRYDLEKRFDREPAAALQALHEQACADSRRDLLYALAELNYLHADRLHRSVKPGAPAKAPDFYLAAAIYAWFYLLDESPAPPPSPYDRRFRVACDLYNYGVALGFAAGPRTNLSVHPANGSRPLAPGRVEIQFSQPAFKWNLADIELFLPADEFAVRGLNVRDRQSGLGAPLIAVGKVLDEKKFTRRIPATLLLRVPGNVREWSADGLHASLELYSTYEVEQVNVGGKSIPLESDTTAPLAHGLNESYLWQLGSAQFFSAEEKIKSGIYFSQPYERGRIPVIFVHGTFSSPVWWAEMWNTLRADPVLRERCQFWNFIYNSGNPIPASAARLRAEIDRKVRQLDPDGTDPALRQMVVIGHSQGGLLTKLTATDTGDHLWRAMSEKEFDQLDLPAEELEALRQRVFFKPLPGVKRVVFISTPHRGSYMATSFVRSLLLRFMKLPEDLMHSSAKLLGLQNPLGLKPGYERRVPNSLDGMSPKNPWLLALAELPTAPDVTAHSVVAVKGNAKPPAGGDGVVRYTSAHVEGVKSEFVARSGHSCQDKPAVIEEIRRILLEHLAELPAPVTKPVPP